VAEPFGQLQSGGFSDAESGLKLINSLSSPSYVKIVDSYGNTRATLYLRAKEMLRTRRRPRQLHPQILERTGGRVERNATLLRVEIIVQGREPQLHRIGTKTDGDHVSEGRDVVLRQRHAHDRRVRLIS
jgi:hypothetical protein